MTCFLATAGIVLGLAATAAADPTIVVTPTSAHPGEPLQFFVAKRGYQALYAIALEVNEDHILVELQGGPKPVSVPVVAKKFPETSVIVEEEMANPPKADRDLIDADNRAIGESYAKASGAP
jgi:hypothetical protein